MNEVNDSESDILLPSVGTQDSLDSFKSKEEKDDNELGNKNNDPVEVSLFTTATGPTLGVAEDGTTQWK